MPVPSVNAPLKNVTVPVGVPAAVVTVAVSVIVFPNVPGETGAAARVVVVLEAGTEVLRKVTILFDS